MKTAQSINYQTLGDKMRYYKKHPFSLLAAILVGLAALITVCAVSYTHLDVYKRQALLSAVHEKRYREPHH